MRSHNGGIGIDPSPPRPSEAKPNRPRALLFGSPVAYPPRPGAKLPMLTQRGGCKARVQTVAGVGPSSIAGRSNHPCCRALNLSFLCRNWYGLRGALMLSSQLSPLSPPSSSTLPAASLSSAASSPHAEAKQVRCCALQGLAVHPGLQEVRGGGGGGR